MKRILAFLLGFSLIIVNTVNIIAIDSAEYCNSDNPYAIKNMDSKNLMDKYTKSKKEV